MLVKFGFELLYALPHLVKFLLDALSIRIISGRRRDLLLGININRTGYQQRGRQNDGEDSYLGFHDGSNLLVESQQS